MRASVTAIFFTRAGHLVEPPDADELIINCYRLADRFHQNPDVFLSMPITDIDRHVRYTVKLTKLQRAAQERGADDDD